MLFYLSKISYLHHEMSQLLSQFDFKSNPLIHPPYSKSKQMARFTSLIFYRKTNTIFFFAPFTLYLYLDVILILYLALILIYVYCSLLLLLIFFCVKNCTVAIAVLTHIYLKSFNLNGEPVKLFASLKWVVQNFQ